MVKRWLARLRNDALVWAGVALIAWALSSVHQPLAVALVGAALVLDGVLGRRA